MGVLRDFFKDTSDLLFGVKPDKDFLTSWQEQLKSRSFEFAQDERDRGGSISDQQVDILLWQPDVKWCAGKCPMEFVGYSEHGYSIALHVMREGIREHLKLTVSEPSPLAFGA